MSEDDREQIGEGDRHDRATVARLARLRSAPVDTARLERSIGALIPLPATRRSGRWFLGRPMGAAAAVLLIVGVTAAVLLNTSGGPALASPAQMAQVHEDMVSGKMQTMQVSSLQEANRALAAQWPDSPGIPALPADHVMACCMKSVKNKKVACVLLRNEGEPITMTIARASDMSLPTSPTATRDGVTYHIQSFNDLFMVMTERNGRWVCLIGKVPAERLMDVATRLQL